MKNKLKNSLIRSFLFLIKIFFKRNDETIPPKILIVSTTAIGDTLWATPCILDIKKTYPSSYLAALTSKTGAEILKNNPHLEDVFIFKNIFLLLHRLRRKRFNYLLIFHTSQRLVLPFCFLLGANKIVGIKGNNKGLDSLLTETLESEHIHEIEKRRKIIQAIQVEGKSTTLLFFPTDEERKEVEALLNKENKYLLGMHLGANDNFKCMPSFFFKKLALLISEKIDCKIIFTGSKKEEKRIKDIVPFIPGAKNFCNKLDLRYLACLIEKMDLLITNDTGPLHLASSLGTKTLSFFVPTDPDISGPFYDKKAHIIRYKETCSPCLKRKCLEPFCFLQVSPQEALKKVLNILRNL